MRVRRLLRSPATATRTLAAKTLQHISCELLRPRRLFIFIERRPKGNAIRRQTCRTICIPTTPLGPTRRIRATNPCEAAVAGPTAVAAPSSSSSSRSNAQILKERRSRLIIWPIGLTYRETATTATATGPIPRGRRREMRPAW